MLAGAVDVIAGSMSIVHRFLLITTSLAAKDFIETLRWCLEEKMEKVAEDDRDEKVDDVVLDLVVDTKG